MFFWNKNKNKTSSDKKEPELALLKTVSNNYELAAIKGILDNNNIRYLINDTAMGGYLKITTGTMFGNADIVVEKIRFKQSKRIN